MAITEIQTIEIMSYFKDYVDDGGNLSIPIQKVLSYDFVNSMEAALNLMSELVSLGLLADTLSKKGELWLLTDKGRMYIKNRF